MRTVVGVDIGGTHLRAALFARGDPSPLRQAETLTRAEDGPDAVLERLFELIRQVLPDSTQGLHIGIGAPGPLDSRRGIVFGAPNLPGWVDLPLAPRVAETFGCPVTLENDANLAALAEWKLGAGRGTQDMLYLTLSTGIGGGAVSGGRLITGHLGLAAEPGHITVDAHGPACSCGQPGHLEALAAGPALARLAMERIQAGEPSSLRESLTGNSSLSAEQVGDAARAGDGLARRIVREAGQLIGLHLATLVHLFNPEVIVVGGGLSHIGPLLTDPIWQQLQASVMNPAFLTDVRLVPSELGDEAGLVGAMLRASEG